MTGIRSNFPSADGFLMPAKKDQVALESNPTRSEIGHSRRRQRVGTVRTSAFELCHIIELKHLWCRVFLFCIWDEHRPKLVRHKAAVAVYV